MTFEEYRTQIAAYDCATYFEKYPEIDTTLEHLGRQFDQMEPAVRAQGCRIWDVEYVREAGQWYLRLYLDKDGGVDILDCEAISRTVSDLLDEADPIESSYVFEVGSAGLERQLKRPGDFAQFMGSPVLVKTYQPKDGRKEFAGTLAGYEDGAVLLDMGGETVRFEKNETALVRLRVEF